MTRRLPLMAVGAVALAALVSGCGGVEVESRGPAASATVAPSPSDRPEPVSSVPVEQLFGRRFLVERWPDQVDGPDGTASFGRPWPESSYLSFLPGSVSGSAGCNTVGGRATFDDDVLVADEVFSTLVGCGQPLEGREALLSSVLRGRPTVRLDGPVLTLSTPTVTIRAVDEEVADPDRPLVGTTWTYAEMVPKGGGVMGIAIEPPAVVPSITFSSDGTWSATLPCAPATGTYAIDPDGPTLDFGTVTLPPGGCQPDIARIEQILTDVLAGRQRFDIAGPRLTLGDPGAADALMFRAPS